MSFSMGNEIDLQRVTPAGWKAFLRIMKAWRVADATACTLLCVSLSTLRGARNALKDGRVPTALNQDQVTRVSLLIGITSALRILHSRSLADQWMSLPNRNVIFGGRPPMEYAQSEGILGLYEIRKLLDVRQDLYG